MGMTAKASGKVKEIVLKRSVLKELDSVFVKEIERPGPGVDASVYPMDDQIALAVNVASMEVSTEFLTECTLYKALNNLYIRQAQPFGITMSIMTRYGTSERELKELCRTIGSICKEEAVSVLSGETFRSSSSKDHVLTIQALGRTSTTFYQKPTNVQGLDLVMVGYAGNAGTYHLYTKKKEVIEKRFSSLFLEGVQRKKKELSIKNHRDLVKNCLYAHDVSTGGIFTALWEIGDYLNCGMQIQMQNILLTQDTIEICELFDLNPYLLFSLGCAVYVTEHGEKLVQSFEDAKIPAAVIGHLTNTSDRILDNGEEVRFLEPYKGDEIYHIN